MNQQALIQTTSAEPAHLAYRPEIDGLRALAVMPVVLFHAGVPGFGGGFVGVDIFFVISGYLITSILLKEQRQTGTISITRFYERRARRILPALLFVLAVCVPIAWWILLPRALSDFAASSLATLGFASNIYFWLQAGYFDTAAELKPLLHTWSLAVEEQFYLLFPLLIIVTARLPTKLRLSIFAAIAAASLLVAERYASQSFGFFLLPTRAWELLAGSFCAVIPAQRTSGTSLKARNALSAFGVALLLIPVFTYGPGTRFPGLSAVAPCLGAVLIILFASRETIAGRLLATSGFVGIGLVSYSLYLWHQPLLAFARSYSLTHLHWTSAVVVCALAAVLATCTWFLIERPFRRHNAIRTSTAILALGAGAAAIGCAAIVTVSLQGVPSRLPETLRWETFGQKLEALGPTCDPVQMPEYPGALSCAFGDRSSANAVVLWGDSHADALASALDKSLRERGMRGLRVKTAECQPIPGTFDSREIAKAETCSENFRKTLKFIADQHASAVIISMRWTFRLFPVPGRIDALSFDNGDGGIEIDNNYREIVAFDGTDFTTAGTAKQKAVGQMLTDFSTVADRLVVVEPVPELGWDIARGVMQNQNPSPDYLSTSLDLYQERNGLALDIISEHLPTNAVTVRPASMLCNTMVRERCVAFLGQVPLYYDDDHLSDIGAELVVRDAMAALGHRSDQSAQ